MASPQRTGMLSARARRRWTCPSPWNPSLHRVHGRPSVCVFVRLRRVIARRVVVTGVNVRHREISELVRPIRQQTTSHRETMGRDAHSKGQRGADVARLRMQCDKHARGHSRFSHPFRDLNVGDDAGNPQQRLGAPRPWLFRLRSEGAEEDDERRLTDRVPAISPQRSDKSFPRSFGHALYWRRQSPVTGRRINTSLRCIAPP
jgi:hypothetical protein